MTPIKTNLCNFTYTAPAGMTAEQCGDLHCMRNPENHTITSFWKPEPEEAAAIASGGLVMLTIHGLAHPPVFIGACTTEENAKLIRPPLLNQEELYAAMGKLINHIEACGGSPQLTTTVMLASDINQAIGNQWNPASEHAAQRVRAIIA
jgi:hypothetical protein